MANPLRGEVAITLNGEVHVMRLTLGALATLENRLGVGSLMDVAEKFESGRVPTSDLISLLAAGLQGGGHAITEEELSDLEISGGAVGAMRCGMALLSLAFRPYGDAAA